MSRKFPKQFAAPDAINQIELRLAQAPDQCWEYRDRFLARLGADINEWSKIYEWGPAVRTHFLKHSSDLRSYIYGPLDDGDLPALSYLAVRDGVRRWMLPPSAGPLG